MALEPTTSAAAATRRVAGAAPPEAFSQAREALAAGRVAESLRILHSVRESGNVGDRAAASRVIRTIEDHYLGVIRHKADREELGLRALLQAKTPSEWYELLSPLTSLKTIAGHYDNLATITNEQCRGMVELQRSLDLVRSVMSHKDLTLAEMVALPEAKLSEHLQSTHPEGDMRARMRRDREVREALRLGDVAIVAQGLGRESELSWVRGKPYVETEYMRSEMDIIAHSVGEHIREARGYDDALMQSDSLLERIIGHGSAAVLDTASDLNSGVNDALHEARDYYALAAKRGSKLAYAGLAATTTADFLAAPVTTGLTLADHRVSDDVRSGAVTQGFIMAGTIGLMKGGGPAMRELAATAPGQAVTRLATRTGTAIAESSTGRALAALDESFAASRFAQAVDRVSMRAPKLKPASERGPALEDAPGPLPPSAAELRRDTYLHSIAGDDAMLHGELSKLDADAFTAVFGEGVPPFSTRFIAGQPGFADFARANPRLARRMITAADHLDPWQVGMRAHEHFVSGGQWGELASALDGELPRMMPHGEVSGYLKVDGAGTDLQMFPRYQLRPSVVLDHNGAFQLAGDQARSALPNLRPLRPADVIVDGRPLGSLDNVFVFSGHGNSAGISGLAPREVATLIAGELEHLPQGSIRHVVLEACSQRNSVGLLGASSSRRISDELRRVLAERGLPPVDVYAASRPGLAYAERFHLTQDAFLPSGFDVSTFSLRYPRVAARYTPAGSLPDLPFGTMLRGAGLTAGGLGLTAGGAYIYMKVADAGQTRRQ